MATCTQVFQNYFHLLLLLKSALFAHAGNMALEFGEAQIRIPLISLACGHVPE